MSTLEPLGRPVSQARYDGLQEHDEYIVFVEYNQAPWMSADNKEMYTKHFYQVDVFSPRNYLSLVNEVKTRLKNAGFGRMFESETYDEDLGKYRKILRFSYISQNEYEEEE